MTLTEIKENNLRCVIKVDSREEAVKLFEIFNPNGYDVNYVYGYLRDNYWKGDGTVCFNVADNKIDGFDTETYFKKNEEQYGKIYRFKDLIAKEGIIGTFKGTPVYADSKIVRMADGTIIGDFSAGGFCDGFRGGKIPTPEKPVPIEEQIGLPKGISIHDLPINELIVPWNMIPNIHIEADMSVAELSQKLSEHFNTLSKQRGYGKRADNIYFDENAFKEEKKMPTKFTFYTVDTSRINKTNNTKVDTIMTCVHIGDKVGYATCDKEDYDEREGILNAIANLCCNGSFDKAYRKAVKEKKISETLDRTCSYCRKVFDTVEERQEHEAWHIERRKARHERYLLRKRAKEIAFEEQAQKMAKEMIGEQK